MVEHDHVAESAEILPSRGAHGRRHVVRDGVTRMWGRDGGIVNHGWRRHEWLAESGSHEYVDGRGDNGAGGNS
jgi:hypothetical protein